MMQSQKTKCTYCGYEFVPNHPGTGSWANIRLESCGAHTQEEINLFWAHKKAMAQAV